MPEFVTVERTSAIATVTLSRPDVHNAFNAEMIAQLDTALYDLARDPAVRVVVLAGAGRSFCAGGDLNWMRSSLEWSAEEQQRDATALADLFDTAWKMPKPLIGRIHGAAVGGGVGLVACCDIALAAERATFGLSEVRIGLVPAIIAQYVVPTIGLSQARALFVSGERISAQRALEIGLVHRVLPEDQLDAAVAETAQQLLANGPNAIANSKRLIDAVWTLDRAAARQYVIDAIVDARRSDEGQEGMRAFLEKRKPRWLEELS
jgi:methylglutaconyl-CoA hydratase